VEKIMINIIYPVVVTILTLTFSTFPAVVNNSYAHGKEKHASARGNVTYTKDIKPIFDKKCAKCHGKKSPEHMEFVNDVQKYTKKKIGPKMDSYSHLVSFVIWPDAGSLAKALDDGKNTQDGKPGKMYERLGQTNEERQKNLNIFKKWIGYWTFNDWSDIKKEDINKMKLAY
jgi:hypothetical protein